jgi:putative inorganic carbon (hco3(-)) transporter
MTPSRISVANMPLAGVESKFGRRLAQGALIGVVPVALAYLEVASPLLLGAALVALILFWIVITRATTMMLVLVACLPWEGYLEYPTETLTLVKVLGLLLMISYVIRALVTEQSFVAAPAIVPAGLLSLSLLVSLIGSPNPSEGLLDTSRYLLYILFFFLVVQLASDRALIVRVIQVFVSSAAIAAVVGVVGVLSGAHARATGPIKDPNDFAYLLSTIVPLATYLFWRSSRARWVWLLAALAGLAGVLSTLSRGAIVALGVLLIWALLARKVRIRASVAFVLAGILLVAVAFAVFGGTLENSLRQKSNIAAKNVDSRTAFWVASLKMSADHPFLGIGPGRLPDVLPLYVRNDPVRLDQGEGHILRVHNSYLEILTEEGPLALVCFAAFLLTSWIGLRRVFISATQLGDEDAVRLADSLQGALVVAIVGAFFISIQTGIPFWLLGGLASATYSRGWLAQARSSKPPRVVSTVRRPGPATP